MKPQNKLQKLIEESEFTPQQLQTALFINKDAYYRKLENPLKLTLEEVQILAFLLDKSQYDMIVTVLEHDEKNVAALKLRFVREKLKNKNV